MTDAEKVKYYESEILKFSDRMAAMLLMLSLSDQQDIVTDEIARIVEMANKIRGLS